MNDMESQTHLFKTGAQELQEVISGRKPAALGFWERIPDGVHRCELQRVPGRYYKYAIGHTRENLLELVFAYYIPISAKGDDAVGKALGYSQDAIDSYIAGCSYGREEPLPGWKIKWLKVITTVEKQGLKTVLAALYARYFSRNKDLKTLVKRVLDKEGFYKPVIYRG